MTVSKDQWEKSLRIDGNDGSITAIKDSSLQEAGLKTGMTLSKIKGAEITQDLMGTQITQVTQVLQEAFEVKDTVRMTFKGNDLFNFFLSEF